jgi:hypothetical protein
MKLTISILFISAFSSLGQTDTNLTNQIAANAKPVIKKVWYITPEQFEYNKAHNVQYPTNLDIRVKSLPPMNAPANMFGTPFVPPMQYPQPQPGMMVSLPPPRFGGVH